MSSERHENDGLNENSTEGDNDHEAHDKQRRRFAAESEGLEPIRVGRIGIGLIDDINGEDAELISFEPTRGELKTLAYHYLERFFAVHATFASGYSGSFESREASFCWRRFHTIAETLSPDELIKEFEEEIARKWAYIKKLRAEDDEPCAENRLTESEELQEEREQRQTELTESEEPCAENKLTESEELQAERDQLQTELTESEEIRAERDQLQAEIDAMGN